MFYANLNFDERVVTYEVCKTKICLTLEDFENLCYLSFLDK